MYQFNLIEYFLTICTVFSLVHTAAILNSQWDTSATKLSSELELKHLCENNLNSIELKLPECTYNNFTIRCYGGVTNLSKVNRHYRKTAHLIICNWLNNSFDAHLLQNFTKIHSIHIEGGNMTHIINDFPELNHLEHITIINTKLRHTRPTLFSKLISIKFIDLRDNHMQHVDGPLLLPYGFDGMYLSSNPWNCSRNFKWLLNYVKAKRIVDRNKLECMDSRFIGRPVITVTQYKQVIKINHIRTI